MFYKIPRELFDTEATVNEHLLPMYVLMQEHKSYNNKIIFSFGIFFTWYGISNNSRTLARAKEALELLISLKAIELEEVPKNINHIVLGTIAETASGFVALQDYELNQILKSASIKNNFSFKLLTTLCAIKLYGKTKSITQNEFEKGIQVSLSKLKIYVGASQKGTVSNYINDLISLGLLKCSKKFMKNETYLYGEGRKHTTVNVFKFIPPEEVNNLPNIWIESSGKGMESSSPILKQGFKNA